MIQTINLVYKWFAITIPRGSNDKDVVAMLDELTVEANEESFVIVLQHGGNDVVISVPQKHFKMDYDNRRMLTLKITSSNFDYTGN